MKKISPLNEVMVRHGNKIHFCVVQEHIIMISVHYLSSTVDKIFTLYCSMTCFYSCDCIILCYYFVHWYTLCNLNALKSKNNLLKMHPYLTRFSSGIRVDYRLWANKIQARESTKKLLKHMNEYVLWPNDIHSHFGSYLKHNHDIMSYYISNSL